jgi:hypothetical protein
MLENKDRYNFVDVDLVSGGSAAPRAILKL